MIRRPISRATEKWFINFFLFSIIFFIVSIGTYFHVTHLVDSFSNINEIDREEKFQYFFGDNHDLSIEKDGKNDNLKFRIPELISNINSVDLRNKIDRRITENCYFCAYPEYPRNFKVMENITYFADAWIGTYETYSNEFYNEIVIMASVPMKCTSYRNSGSYCKRLNIYAIKKVGRKYINVIFRNKKIPSFEINCEMKHNIRTNFLTFTFNCKIPEDKKKLIYYTGGCFYADLFIGKFSMLTSPMLVRHCQKEEKFVQKDVALCTQVHQQDSLFLIEWIEYHLMLGVDHIYLYNHLGVNMNTYETTIWYMLDTYITKGQVSVFMWNYTYPTYYRTEVSTSKKAGDEIAAFNDCLHRFGYKYKWMGFFDTDEYWVPTKRKTIYEVLKKYNNERRSVVAYAYIMSFNKSPGKDLLIETYPEIDEKFNMESKTPGIYHKSFVETNNCFFYFVHECRTTRNWNDFFLHSMYFISDEIEMYIAHYYFKKYHQINPLYENNEVTHTSPIQRFLPELKKRVILAKYLVNFNKIYKFCNETSTGMVIPLKFVSTEKAQGFDWPTCSRHREELAPGCFMQATKYG